MKFTSHQNIFLSLCLCTLLVSFAGQSQAQDIDFSSSNLPILLIDTHGQQIVDPYRIPADLKIIYNGKGERNYLNDSTFHYDGTIDIELRGSTSQNWPKQPYRFETIDSSGANLNVSLLGMAEENDWILHNPWSDKTLIRNVLTFKISNDLGRYASRTRFCEVWLNEQYMGVYVLMEKIKRDKNRIDIANLDSSDIAGEDLTGGYIIKIDKTDGEQIGGWRSAKRTNYQYHYPKPSEILDVQKEYIKNFMDRFEALVDSPGYANPDTGYTTYFDVNAFVDFSIVNEISKNVDGYRLSTFMYKDRDRNGGLLTLGPVWDFNLSFGNSYYYDGARVENWNIETLFAETRGDFPPPFWMEIIWNDATFKSRFAQRWKSLRQTTLHTDALLSYIDAIADTLNEAQQRNFLMWPILGRYEWPNFFIGDTWEEEIEHLKEWTRARAEWMDANVDKFSRTTTSVATNQHIPAEYSLEQNYPNPFNPSTTIQYSSKKDSHITLKIYNSLGQHIKTLADEFQHAGCHAVVWNGADQLGNAVPSGLYTYRLQANSEIFTRKMLLIQ
ncbi:T9SS C-terminal target domain-containing protein [candidate division KSB1 bacterium]|nr:CotH kinase family protein [candidate division KSB1 bacterium]RQW00992.1 MAG: T9SS C-terminal target domain-containing protein [candidate division KSB1 bacterium]